MAPTPLLLLLLLLLAFHSVASQAAPGGDVYQSFVQCLYDQTKAPPGSLSSVASPPSNPSFSADLNARVRNLRYKTAATAKPVLIVVPVAVPQVQATVVCAKNLNLQLRTRSGGHDYEGVSYTATTPGPFAVLDMFNLRSISVDAAAKTAVVQSGASLGELYHAISQKSKLLGFPAGVSPTVGVGGHITGGGYGTLMRKYGLSSDNVIGAEIVDVRGKVMDREGMGEDLFWAIRGGGGASFGVIVSYTLQLVAVPPTVTGFRVEKFAAEGGTEVVAKFLAVAARIDPDLFIRVLIQPVTPKGDSKAKGKTTKLTFMSVFQGEKGRLLSVLNRDLPELGLTAEQCQEFDWIHSVLFFSNFDPVTSPVEALLNRTEKEEKFLKRKSDFVVRPLTKAELEGLWKKVETGGTGMVFNQMGGKMGEIPEGASPYPHRAGHIVKVQYSGNWEEEDGGDAVTGKWIREMRELYEFTAPLVSQNPREAFLNYRDLDIGINSRGTYEEGEVYGRKYFKGNFDRLVKVKTAVDPGNFFHYEQSIPPRSS